MAVARDLFDLARMPLGDEPQNAAGFDIGHGHRARPKFAGGRPRYQHGRIEVFK